MTSKRAVRSPWINYFNLLDELWQSVDDTSAAVELDVALTYLQRYPEFDSEMAAELAEVLVSQAREYIGRAMFSTAKRALEYAAAQPAVNSKARAEFANLQFRGGDHRGAEKTLLELAADWAHQPERARDYLHDSLAITKCRDSVYRVAEDLEVPLESLTDPAEARAPMAKMAFEREAFEDDDSQMRQGQGLGAETTEPGTAKLESDTWQLTPGSPLKNCLLLLRLVNTFDEPAEVAINDAAGEQVGALIIHNGKITQIGQGTSRQEATERDQVARTLLEVLSHGEGEELEVRAQRAQPASGNRSAVRLGDALLAAARHWSDYPAQPIPWDLDSLLADDLFEWSVLRQVAPRDIFVPIKSSTTEFELDDFHRLLTHAQRLAELPGQFQVALDDEHPCACIGEMQDALWLVARKGADVLLIRAEPRRWTQLLRLLPNLTDHRTNAVIEYD
ncbi:hypothetical protein FIV42_25225 [Persicimonas caeni]|uniref:Uncharacterized protein n=1 Tax=Persicimonas caeni TaxID=2292766 RepID=A0A4Y6Q030_PERCE|nr:hypothetical protein [Persicimonas caeni]QDG53924.1 hypothetical protein FIV42_25225 [Persicimonas caeni]QED35145.1 hypothetical protein FRD00_25220 [Persicimonas caeni]